MYTEENHIVYPPRVEMFSQEWLKKVIKNITTQGVLVTNASGYKDWLNFYKSTHLNSNVCLFFILILFVPF